MATFGALNKFSGIDSDWSSYNERYTFYCIDNKITDDDIKRAMFLSIVGDKTYQLIRGLLTPKCDVNYYIITTMTNIYNPKKRAILKDSNSTSVIGSLVKQFQHMFLSGAPKKIPSISPNSPSPPKGYLVL